MKRRIIAVVVVAASLSFAAAYAFGPSGITTAAPMGPKSTSIGVKVHGNWVVEVRSRSGQLVQRRKFENALTSFGGDTLAGLLNSDWTVSSWGIGLGAGFPSGGVIAPSTSRVGGAFIVSGSVVATADTTITSVQTVAGRSGGLGFSTITFKTLAAPIPVLNGQQVLAKVTITFS